MIEHIRTWRSQGLFTLELYDFNKRDGDGKWLLGYQFFFGAELIFSGADFHCSPMHAVDSNETVASLLGFLSLRPGDTDADYFDRYTPRQLEFANQYGEELSLHAYDLEETARAD